MGGVAATHRRARGRSRSGGLAEAPLGAFRPGGARCSQGHSRWTADLAVKDLDMAPAAPGSCRKTLEPRSSGGPGHAVGPAAASHRDE